MDKIVFLDFDGVLNTEYYQGWLCYRGKPWKDEYGAIFDPVAVAQLKRIIDATNADIVIESSWKQLGLTAMLELWDVRHLPGRVIDITPSSVSDSWLRAANLVESGLEMRYCKGAGIAFWLSNNVAQETRYVIIDDEYVILDAQLPHFILTNPFEGITKEQADTAISILNSQN